MPGFIDRALSIAVTDDDDDETRRTKRLLTGALLVSLATPWLTIAQLIAAEAVLGAWAVSISNIVALLALLTMWVKPSTFPGVYHLIVGANLAVSAAMTLMFGGFLASGVNFVWTVILVLGALVIFEDKRATIWLVVSIAVLVGSVVAAGYVDPLYDAPNPELSSLATFLVVLIFAYFVVWYYVEQRSELLALSEGLLKNILPDRIASRLKNSDEMIADEYESASILFADVVGFTPMSADMEPQELVALLDEIFSDFDTMVEQRGLEKIKTIGDAYMVASGVPVSRADHAVAICDLALEMSHHVRDRLFSGKSITLRIGINSGPVVAGIIGTRKFSYDLWGDAVNTASRMESFGTPGRIQITEATRDLVAEEFVCEPAGIVEVKGKGAMHVWFLEGRNTPADH